MDGGNRVLDDLAKLATSAVGVLQGAGREAEGLLRQQVERLVDRMDLVSREEFEAVKAMAAAAREENERLAARLAELETLRPKASPAKSKPRKSATAAGRASGKRPAKGAPRRKRQFDE